MIRAIRITLLLNLAAIVVITFAFPDLMLSPGKLIDEHAAYDTDCFACHDTFFGAPPEKCISCHETADIGIRTTAGTPVANKKTTVPFHQNLIEHDCVACHSDHLGAAKYRDQQQFSHGLLDPATRKQCLTCHQKPEDTLHIRVQGECAQCHDLEKWTPATFKHDTLPATKRDQCITCHEDKLPANALHRQAPDACGKCHGIEQWALATFEHDILPRAAGGECGACHEEEIPSDVLHRQVSNECGHCHETERWKPATYDHSKSFAFDRDHSATCTNCHTTTDYKKYTCYECHEHSRRNVRKEHLEEGIRDYTNCVTCHRNADEHEAERAWRSIKRGIPYQFGSSHETRGGNWKRRHHDDDDDDDD